MVLKFLQQATFHVRMAYGNSEMVFSNFVDYVLGLFQGTGHAGPGWVLMSSMMLDRMDTTHSAKFHSP